MSTTRLRAHPRLRRPALRPPSWRQALRLAAFIPALLIWWQAADPLGPIGYDFTSYLAAAHAVALGHDPYHRLLAEYPGLRSGSQQVVAGNGYLYPPLLAELLAVPLRLGLGDRALWLLWCVVVLAAVLWMAYELSRVRAPAPARRWAIAALCAALAMVAAIARYDLSLGQSDLLMAALAVGAQGLSLRGRRGPACLALGLAIAVKPMLALLLLVWLWKGDRRGFVIGAGAALALLLGPFLLIGALTPLHEYVTFFGAWSALHGNADYINQSAYGMLLRVLTVNSYSQPLVVAPWLVLPLRAAIVLGAGALWIAAVPRRRTSAAAARELCEYLLALPLLLLVNPLSEDIHYCLLIPALIGLAGFARASIGWRPATVALWATLALCCLPRMQELIFPDRFLTLPGQHDPRLGPLIVLLRTNLLLIAAAVALVAGHAALRRSPPPDTGPGPGTARDIAAIPEPSTVASGQTIARPTDETPRA